MLRMLEGTEVEEGLAAQNTKHYCRAPPLPYGVGASDMELDGDDEVWLEAPGKVRQPADYATYQATSYSPRSGERP